MGAAGYLVAEGNKAKNWAIEMQKAQAPTRELVEAVQQERHLSLALLAGDETAGPALAAARPRMDSAFRGLIAISTGIRKVDDSKIGDDLAGFNTLFTQMAAVRSGVDAGQIPPGDAYVFYNHLLDVVSVGSQVAQQSAPDAEIGVEIAEGMRTLYATEAMSRSNALAFAMVTENRPGPVPMDEFLRQIGYYHTEIVTLTTEIDGYQKELGNKITHSASWQRLSEMESAIAQRNTTPATVPNSSSSSSSSSKQATTPPLPLTMTEWQSTAAEVNKQLVDLWMVQNKHTQELAEEKAARDERNSLLGGIAVVAISLTAFLIALVLANRIIRRLKRLRGQTLLLADERLPEMMRKLREGETVYPAAESPVLDYGRDEIGQVAKAFQHAHAAAVAGAIAEARTREGVKAVFLNIAHRSQIVVHRQLEILDDAERRQEDPALLDTLFRLDHLATRERRNAENLIILGGGQPGRQWRNPVPLIDLVRSAIGETLDYARVRVARQPEVQIAGTVVADLIHLLAELVDNATAFSPPQSRVEVSGNIVGKGVVTEIIDQGMGMPEAELTRVNEMLRHPPDFGVAALSSDSRLGLFVVAQLAARHGVSVRLTESDYGGIRAIVLIPTALIAGETAALAPTPELADPARHQHFPPPAALESAAAAAPEPLATPTATMVVEPPKAVSANGLQHAEEARTTPDGRPALPRRNRQASLAPELAEPAIPEPAPERARSAEQARDLMSAIENGTRQGRKPLSSSTDEQEGK
ncbi:nitrate- and nitrite sensing domain-containing protein [Nocardia sp. NPDC052566]|uniref:sensor histidine kinase n=1 Tax=Nocardia sp. NPDC052566 TaxID=3364330 RepID=UPI0037C6E828